mgnify:FL=1
MSETIRISTEVEKVLNACHRLNAEAFVMQGRARFVPCQKAETLMTVIRNGAHFGTAHLRASIAICPCHNDMSEQELMEYEHDPTFRLANYRHDYRTLYGGASHD